MVRLELLAPAGNLQIGIAAVDCGADAVYIAGPEFGARKAAGNPVGDIAALCRYARQFGVRVYATVNTIIRQEETARARAMVSALRQAGVDALIVQDPRVLSWPESAGMEMHASTQCSILTPGDALRYAGMGFRRLVPERQLSLRGLKAIAQAVPDCEVEAFVHGALCVSYSGRCYLSACITGRSANRGECAQPCRTRFDLYDAEGALVARNRAVLSLKDLNLSDRLGALAAAGVSSFKIEGRLKNISYVRNTVLAYSRALDALIAAHPGEYCRASFGKVESGFVPNLGKTFNRGYTSLFLDGKRGSWASQETPKGVGEYIGRIAEVSASGTGVRIKVEPAYPGLKLSSGDGFAVVSAVGIDGFRAETAQGLEADVSAQGSRALRAGMKLYRNFDRVFEQELEKGARRFIPAGIFLKVKDGYMVCIEACDQSGRKAMVTLEKHGPVAENAPRMMEMLRSGLARRSGVFSFGIPEISVGTSDGSIPFLSSSEINGLRREAASVLASSPFPEPAETSVMKVGPVAASVMQPQAALSASGVEADSVASSARTSPDNCGTAVPGTGIPGAADRNRRPSDTAAGALEKDGPVSSWAGVELMRMKYCVRYEYGRCPFRQAARDVESRLAPGPDGRSARSHGGRESSGTDRTTPTASDTAPWTIVNNGRRFNLNFDCAACEMTVTTSTGPRR